MRIQSKTVEKQLLFPNHFIINKNGKIVKLKLIFSYFTFFHTFSYNTYLYYANDCILFNFLAK